MSMNVKMVDALSMPTVLTQLVLSSVNVSKVSMARIVKVDYTTIIYVVYLQTISKLKMSSFLTFFYPIFSTNQF